MLLPLSYLSTKCKKCCEQTLIRIFKKERKHKGYTNAGTVMCTNNQINKILRNMSGFSIGILE